MLPGKIVPGMWEVGKVIRRRCSPFGTAESSSNSGCFLSFSLSGDAFHNISAQDNTAVNETHCTGLKGYFPGVSGWHRMLRPPVVFELSLSANGSLPPWRSSFRPLPESQWLLLTWGQFCTPQNQNNAPEMGGRSINGSPIRVEVGNGSCRLLQSWDLDKQRPCLGEILQIPTSVHLFRAKTFLRVTKQGAQEKKTIFFHPESLNFVHI